MAIRTEESALRVHGTVHNIEGSSPVIDIKASSDKLALNEIARLLPALQGYTLQPAFEVTARGPADRMTVDLALRMHASAHHSGRDGGRDRARTGRAWYGAASSG